MNSISPKVRALFLAVSFVLGATSAQANNANVTLISAPGSAQGGTMIAVRVEVFNTGDNEWGGWHNLVLRDVAGNPVAMESVDGLAPGQNREVTINYGLPNITAVMMFTVEMLEHNVEWFGSAVGLSVSVTAQPPPPQYAGVLLSTTTFDQFSPAVISTTENWLSQMPAYRLRAKVNNGTSWGWHAANLWNMQGYPLDNPPPAGTYWPCSLYYVLYNTLYGTVTSTGPERREQLQIKGSVMLSSNWFHSSEPPTISTAEAMNTPWYRLFATFSNGTGQTWETAGQLNNSGAALTNLPPPGAYAVALQWRKYDAAMNQVDASSVRNVTVQMTGGPVPLLNLTGEVTGIEAYNEWEETYGWQYDPVPYEFQVVTTGQVRIHGTARDGGEVRLNVYRANGEHLQLGIPEVSFLATPGTYRVEVWGDRDFTFDLVGEFFPYAPVLRPGTFTGRTEAATSLTFTAAMLDAVFVDPATNVPVPNPPAVTYTMVWWYNGTVVNPVGKNLNVFHPEAVVTASYAGSGIYPPAKATATFKLTDTTPPSAPSGLMATVTGPTGVALQWQPSSDNFLVKRYEIDADDGRPYFKTKDATEQSQTTPSSIVINGLTANSVYLIKVRAVDFFDNPSSWSTVLVLTPAAPPGPSAASRWRDVNNDGLADELVAGDSQGTGIFHYAVDEVSTQIYTIETMVWNYQILPGFEFGDTLGFYASGWWIPSIEYDTVTVNSVRPVFQYLAEAGYDYALIREAVAPGTNPPVAKVYVLHHAPWMTGVSVVGTREWRPDPMWPEDFFYAYPTILARYSKPARGLQLDLPGIGSVQVGSGGSGGTIALPGGVVVKASASGVSITSGSTTVSTSGGTVTVGVNVGGYVVTGNTNGQITLSSAATGATIGLGPNGGSLTLSGGLGITVSGSGEISLSVPLSTGALVGNAVDELGRLLGVLGGEVWGQVTAPGGATSQGAWGDIRGLVLGNRLPGDYDLVVTSDTRGRPESSTPPAVADLIRIRLSVQAPPPPQIAVDANRDGTITFGAADATGVNTPYRFWINDDDDAEFAQNTVYYIETEKDDKEVTNDANKDCSNLVIDTERDLEDLTRLWINAQGIADALKNGSLRLGLKWTDIPMNSPTPAIRLFKAVEADGGNAYLFNAGTAALQVEQTAATGAHGMAVGSLIEGTNPVPLPMALFTNLSESEPRIYLLFEGAREGKGQIKVVLLNQNDQPVGESSGVWMDLLRPHNFVERFTCGEGSGGEVAGNVTRHPESGPLFGAPLAAEERDYVLYVHGYNMQLFEKQRWLETTYKRLYWLGYKGRVGGFSWPCTFGAVGEKLFDVSERRAWESAARLNEHIQSLNDRGYRVHLLAHSQGNVAAAEALRLWWAAGNATPLVRTYIASQAAIPAACYNPDAPWMPDHDKSTVGTARNPLAPDIYSRYWVAGNDDRRPNAWPSSNLSYLSDTFMRTTASRWANFFNISDYALTGNSLEHPGWEMDQREKPNDLLSEGFAQYTYTGLDGFRRLVFIHTNLLFPGDRYEIFSYGAGAWSLALGTIPTGGVFSNFTNLQSSFQYGSEHRWHSGQFRSFNAVRYQYWGAVLDAALIPHLNP